MVVIIGGIIVLSAVVVGFTMAGGKIGALIHISEFITIGGAAFGALIIMSPPKVMKDLILGILQVLKGSLYGKSTCIQMLQVMYALARLVRQNGLLALDSHVTNPEQSEILQQYPKIHTNFHIRQFLCDSLSLIIDGTVESEQLRQWLEEEIQVLEREHHAAVMVMLRTADSLPGFGIVAAVLGIVVTMQAIGGPVETIGYKVGAALVGTFLGILMAYGFFAPIGARMEALSEQELLFFRALSEAVIAINDGASPKDVVMRARRIIGTACRPTQTEMKELFG